MATANIYKSVLGLYIEFKSVSALLELCAIPLSYYCIGKVLCFINDVFIYTRSSELILDAMHLVACQRTKETARFLIWSLSESLLSPSHRVEVSPWLW